MLFYDQPKISHKPKQFKLDLSSAEFAMKLGWSDQGTRLNVYCYRKEEFTTFTLICAFGGEWKLAT